MNQPAPDSLLLLCIDLQPVFLKAMATGPEVQRRCGFAIQAATGLGLGVAFTEQVPQKLGGTVPELISLAPNAAVYAKATFSALADDAIREAVTARSVEHLLLCGIETSICVYQTAVDALASGLGVTVLSDCIGARSQDDATACLAELARAGAHLLPSESVFYALLRNVRHPFFKTFTQLVKSHG